MAQETELNEFEDDSDEFSIKPKIEQVIEELVAPADIETTEEIQLTNHQQQLIASQNNEFNQNYELFAAMVKSKMLPSYIKTPESAFAVAQMGKELGFDRMTAFNNIIPIQGTLTLKADAQAALMMQGGVRWKVIHDGDYMFTNGEILSIKPYAGKRSKDGKSWEIEPIRDIEGKPYIAYDRITQIEATYLGETHIIKYYWSDAKQHGLTDKDNWVKMPRQMLLARCVSKMRVQIASGTTKGLYTTDEIVDSLNKPPKVERAENGTIIKTIEI